LYLKLGELFCGPGGISFGAHLASEELELEGSERIDHAWAVDYHKSTVETFRRNIPGASERSVICSDVRELSVEKQLAPISDIDLFAYGFPCNDFSLAGEQKGFEGEFGPLYQYGVDVIKYFMPKAFIAENVGGLRSANEGKAFHQIVDDLHSCGYSVIPHYYKFEEYGVPQRRHRVVIVGIRSDLDNNRFKIPAPSHTRFVSVREALSAAPISDLAANHEYTKQSDIVKQRLSHIGWGENAWSSSIPEHLRLNVKGAKLSNIYKRLHPEQPSYTITGSGGGGTHVYHWDEPRALTNRERARLQTFPDHFVFEGKKEEVRRQIGMAVPPVGAAAIIKALARSLRGVDYPSTECNLKDYCRI
jgi:DNA (cytosine-5)-methyltransferase 1